LDTGIIVIAHGSRGDGADVEITLEEIINGIRPSLAPEAEIISATLQFNRPTLHQAVDSLADKGAKKIIIAPYFLFPGRHITEDIPEILEELKKQYPAVNFSVTDNLGLDDSLIELMTRRIIKAAPEISLSHNGNRGSAIEDESMQIIDGLVEFPHGLSAEEIKVAKRIIHASGDPGIMASVKFGNDAVESGIRAITGGCNIFTDVKMVMAGIDSRTCDTFKCTLACALNGGGETDTRYATRTAGAIARLDTRLNGAIVAVGNAPTALLALIDLIDHKEIKPALVVGMPVGFVQAKESKEELTKRSIPYITVTGTRGGSAMAAAAVNALLKIALDKKQN